MDNKRKMLTVRMKPDIINDFGIAADLRGQTMSSLIYQYVLKTIREEKEKAPQAFPDYKKPEPKAVIDFDAEARDKQILNMVYESFDGKDINPELLKAVLTAVRTIKAATDNEGGEVTIFPGNKKAG